MNTGRGDEIPSVGAFGFCFDWVLLCLCLAMIPILGCDKTVGVNEDGSRYVGVTGTGNAGRVIGTIYKDNQPIAEIGFTARLLRFDDSGGVKLAKSVVVSDTGGFEFDSLSTADYSVEIWKDGVLRGQSGRQHVIDSVDLRVYVMIVDVVDRKPIDLELLGGIDSVYVDYRENLGIRSGDKWLVQTLKDTGFVVHTYLSAPRNRWEAWYYLVRDGRVVLMNVADGQVLTNSGGANSAAYEMGAKVVALWDFGTILPGGIVRDRSPHGNDLVLPTSARPIRGLSGGGIRFQGDSGAATVLAGDNGLRHGGDGKRTYEIRFRVDSLPDIEVMICAGDPSMVLVRDENGRLLILGETRGSNEGEDPFMLYSNAEVPVGEWVNLAVSIDESRSELYAWMNDVPLTLYAAVGWVGRTGIRTDLDDLFEVGTSKWYAAEGWISVDELRVSDTLALGIGNEVQLPQQHWSELAFDGSVLLGLKYGVSGLSFQKTDVSAMIGFERTTGYVHRLSVLPKLPEKVAGKEIVVAWLEGWSVDATVVGDLKLEVCPMVNDWDSSGVVSDWPTDSSRGMERKSQECTHGRIVDGENGYFIVDVTNALRDQMSGLNHGFVLRAQDEKNVDGKTIRLSSANSSRSLGITYIYR